MSCEGRFKHFCTAIGGSASLGAAFPDGAQALRDVQEIARNQAPPAPAPVAADTDLATRMQSLSASARETEAETKTVLLFTLMRDQFGIAPPAHGRRAKDGIQVPRREATYGYAAVWNTLQAIADAIPLPELAEAVADQWCC